MPASERKSAVSSSGVNDLQRRWIFVMGKNGKRSGVRDVQSKRMNNFTPTFQGTFWWLAVILLESRIMYKASLWLGMPLGGQACAGFSGFGSLSYERPTLKGAVPCHGLGPWTV